MCQKSEVKVTLNSTRRLFLELTIFFVRRLFCFAHYQEYCETFFYVMSKKQEIKPP